jgi:hypothetical protein
MTTSPTSTCHFTIDTPENCAIWDAITRSDSYFTPAITYGDNNNVDDATAYNDYRRGRQSPGIASDILDAMASLRNMEESAAHLPNCTAPCRGDESTSGPPILEDSSRCVGRRLPVQSILTTGEEMGVAGKSAGNTPYPRDTILLNSGDEEDDDIKCGRCENPIAYCHCSPTMLPPRISTNEEEDHKEEDHKEAMVSPDETSDKENQLVEVCVGRGMGGEADEGGGVQAHRRRMYTPGTPQRATRRSLSPTPDGFIRNPGQNYVPLRIPTTNGRGVAIAKWVKVRMGVNPVAWGCMYKGEVVYQGSVAVAQATCFF